VQETRVQSQCRMKLPTQLLDLCKLAEIMSSTMAMKMLG
jgi:hypothetical protein